jgi:citrate lyase beta subunit
VGASGARRGAAVPDEVGPALDEQLAGVDARLAARRPTGGRQPVHTAYVPADQVDTDTAQRWGAEALAALREHAPEPEDLGVDPEVYRRLVAKLEAEPVEDLRVDFEDGYGARPDDEEDADATRVGSLTARTTTARTGVRIKAFEAPTRARALRTLDLLLTACERLPDDYVVTLPKVTAPEQVLAIRQVLEALGPSLAAVRFEVQVETPHAVESMTQIADAAGPRCAGLHYGTYDYSAALGVAAAHQALDHPVADHAKAVMQVAGAVRALPVVDGSSNVLPVGDTAAVRAAWHLHGSLVRRSLERGIYQGWDMHPGQLVSRYAAVFAFYRGGLAATARRLRSYVDNVQGSVLDEPATARAMTGFLLRGLDCGAIDASEVSGATGLDRAGLRALAQLPAD